MGAKMSRRRKSNDQLEIFKLKMDHFEEIFDWLTLKDLLELSKTCNRMNIIVGYYIKTKYVAGDFNLDMNGIQSLHNPQTKGVKLDPFLKKLRFHYLEYIEYDSREQKCGKPKGIILHMKEDRFKSLTEIRLDYMHLTDNGISRIKGILGQLEAVEINTSHFCCENNEFYESFLQFCTNIKRLYLQDNNNDFYTPNETKLIGADNSWLLQKYSTLEHLELTTDKPGPINELQTFFQRNPQIKTFATDVETILANEDTFKNTNGKWDVLCVRFGKESSLNLLLYRDLLNELHERGVFKQLHLFLSFQFEFNEIVANQLFPINGITKLEIGGGWFLSLSILISVKHLHIGKTLECHETYFETLAKNIVNVDIIEFSWHYFKDILGFILYSPKLKTIVIHSLMDCLDNNAMDDLEIEKLNKKRSKLTNARKITIYAPEEYYLTTKWRTNETNLSFIEIKRYESYNAFKYHIYPCSRDF